ncbi:hypothetical protein BBD42_19750 [Paenibacillus sp. BIHB 4019]|uniref:LysM domain-containing protein n=1 Tax=Paenibacillus sp. BIHB 4019 TaxID=1870819 RepID=A0A1B2DL58_9BACL|nr:hypothetical protein [Paenibacillus sp. BIHB 4019]ANY68458.1 hypothetical protein BBD42_19750 [Paenibacillus sp. BIHB 4019]
MKKLIPITLGLALTFSSSAFAAQTINSTAPVKTAAAITASSQTAIKTATSGGFTVKTDLNAIITSQPLLKLLNVTRDELNTQLKAGKTLETIAKAKGVSTDKVISCLMQTQTTQIAAHVKAGKLTQAKSTQVVNELKTQVKKAVQQKYVTTTTTTTTKTTTTSKTTADSKSSAVDNERLNAAAKALGLTEAQLKKQAEAGKSIVQVAQSYDVSEQTIVNAVYKQDQQWLSDQLQVKWEKTDGTAKGANEDLQRLVDDGYLSKAASSIGVTQQSLLKQLQEGKSLNEVCEENNADTAKLASTLEAHCKDQISSQIKTAGEHFE